VPATSALKATELWRLAEKLTSYEDAMEWLLEG
jgi:hypothetical protein